jgi:hypothetical protein
VQGDRERAGFRKFKFEDAGRREQPQDVEVNMINFSVRFSCRNSFQDSDSFHQNSLHQFHFPLRMSFCFMLVRIEPFISEGHLVCCSVSCSAYFYCDSCR